MTTRAMLQLIWKRKGLLSLITVTSMVLAGAGSYLIEPTFKASVTVYRTSERKQGGGLLGNLSGIASALGYDMGGGTTPFHVPDLVESRLLLGSLLDQRWHTERFSEPVDLITFWGLADKKSVFGSFVSLFGSDDSVNPRALIEAGMAELSSRIDVKEEQSGLYRIFVSIEEPGLAADVANETAAFIQQYVAERTTKRSSGYRAFLEDRLEAAGIELSRSEESLMTFSKQHPPTLDTPELELERGRLNRTIDLNQQVFVTLKQQYELARLEELKEKPVLELLDRASAPTKKDKPVRSLIVLGAGFSAFLIAVYIGLAFERFREIP